MSKKSTRQTFFRSKSTCLPFTAASFSSGVYGGKCFGLTGVFGCSTSNAANGIKKQKTKTCNRIASLESSSYNTPMPSSYTHAECQPCHWDNRVMSLLPPDLWPAVHLYTHTHMQANTNLVLTEGCHGRLLGKKQLLTAEAVHARSHDALELSKTSKSWIFWQKVLNTTGASHSAGRPRKFPHISPLSCSLSFRFPTLVCFSMPDLCLLLYFQTHCATFWGYLMAVLSLTWDKGQCCLWHHRLLENFDKSSAKKK